MLVALYSQYRVKRGNVAKIESPNILSVIKGMSDSARYLQLPPFPPLPLVPTKSETYVKHCNIKSSNASQQYSINAVPARTAENVIVAVPRARENFFQLRSGAGSSMVSKNNEANIAR